MSAPPSVKKSKSKKKKAAILTQNVRFTFKNFYYSILNTNTFNSLVTKLCVTLKRKIESKFSGFNPSLFSLGKNYSGANAYSTRVYIRLWTVPIVRYLRKKYSSSEIGPVSFFKWQSCGAVYSAVFLRKN